MGSYGYDYGYHPEPSPGIDKYLALLWVITVTAGLVYDQVIKINKGGYAIYGRYGDVMAKQDGGNKSKSSSNDIGDTLESIFRIEVPAYLAMFTIEQPIILSAIMFFLRYSRTLNPWIRSMPGGPLSTREIHNDAVVIFFIIHYIYRTAVYPYLFLQNAKPWTVRVVLIAIAFNSLFSPWQSYYNLNYGPDIPFWEYSLVSYLGVLVFFFGLASNYYCDKILQDLRKDPNDKAYYIPRGYLFEYVTGANFFSEAIEWLGYAMFAGNLTSFCYFLMTVANTANRATAHHNWYLKKFPEEYPPSRKIYIPFVF